MFPNISTYYLFSCLINIKLSAIFLYPLTVFLVTLLIPKTQNHLIKMFTISASMVSFFLVCILYYTSHYNFSTGFEKFIPKSTSSDFFSFFVSELLNNTIKIHPNFYSKQFVLECYFTQLNFGVDTLSLLFIILTAFLVFICLILSRDSDNYKEVALCFFSMEFLLFLSWTTTDILLFYVCFESVLIPMFLYINFFGTRDRKYRASYLLFMYTLLGSIGMLISIFFILNKYGTTNILLLTLIQIPFKYQKWLFLGFFLAFAVKIPVFPFHNWLPEAHVEAPTAGSIFLAGILLKLGGYGIFRFLIPAFPLAALYYAPLINALCFSGVFLASFNAIGQDDLKRIIAYASVSHMNLTIISFFGLSILGAVGGLFQLISHGLISVLLFYCVDILYKRSHTRSVIYYGGIGGTMPKFTSLMLFACFANMSLPSTSSFIGEFILLIGIYKTQPQIGIWITFSILFSGIYSIWLLNRICNGAYKNTQDYDITISEFLTVVPFIIMIFFLGLFPNFILADLWWTVSQCTYFYLK